MTEIPAQGLKIGASPFLVEEGLLEELVEELLDLTFSMLTIPPWTLAGAVLLLAFLAAALNMSRVWLLPALSSQRAVSAVSLKILLKYRHTHGGLITATIPS